ncbi:S24 family peptidase [uncultured Thioclava sp.]|uniref:S24 family peptidase n=1 Tax=uncultured Thioclava sp. TaxID=473858 RepID=UPI0025FEC472|nr:S24 family peptidase [uncultured Thioclava sp.]
MKMTFRDALIIAQETSGKSLRSIAIDSDVSYDTLKNLSQGKSQNTNVDVALKVARSFGVSIEEFCEGNFTTTTPLIAVVGRVGAGAKVDLIDAYAKGDGLYHVPCPSGLTPHGIVAVEVEGDSMTPTYEPGSVLFYSRDAIGIPTEALGKICICEDLEGKAWVKQVKPGTEPGLFHLISINPAGINMHDTAIKWAAPVRFSLPPEFVRKIG